MNTPPPDALLFLSSSCPYCPAVLQGLSELVKSGRIGRLEVVNVAHHPDLAQAHNVRSVPWTRIGPFELEGSRSPAELRQWAERAGSRGGMASYLVELFKGGGLDKAIALLQEETDLLDAIVPLAGDKDSDLQVRLGISAALEEMRGQPALARLIEPLTQLARHPDARLRGDAAHYLTLTQDERARPILEQLVQDTDAGVRDVASEGLEMLDQARSPGGA